jgi:hypothetical protein
MFREGPIMVSESIGYDRLVFFITCPGRMFRENPCQDLGTFFPTMFPQMESADHFSTTTTLSIFGLTDYK